MVNEGKNVMDSREIVEHFDKRIDDLRSDMKDNVSEIKTIFGKHLDHCDKNMSGYNDRLKELEADKNKRYGAYGLAIAVVSLIAAIAAAYAVVTGGN